MPWLGAGLPNIDTAGAGREQPLELIVLFPVGAIHIDVQAQLFGLGLVSLVDDDRGLRATEADARGPDLYACSVAFQLDIAQYLAPEPRQQLGITCVQDQFGYATRHLITISSCRIPGDPMSRHRRAKELYREHVSPQRRPVPPERGQVGPSRRLLGGWSGTQA